MDPRLIYMTAASLEEAKSLARMLVEERLAACVNLLPGMTSVYRWEGTVQFGDEIVVIAKTRADLVDAVTARVRELHSYNCPCVVAVPIDGGNPDFLQWIVDETIEEPPTVA